MKNHQKGFAGVAIIIIVALGILGFGAYKVFYKVVPAEESMNLSEGNFPSDYQPADHTDTSPAKTPSVAPDTSNSQTYRNDKYGFELTFPKTWGKITAEGDSDTILFSSSNSGRGEKGPIFHVSVMTEQRWKECQEDAKTGIPFCATNPLTRNSTTIVNWGSALQDPFPKEEERLGEVHGILASFKFTDTSSASSKWKTYTNNQYGFSLQYPPDLDVSTSANTVHRGTTYLSVINFIGGKFSNTDGDGTNDTNRTFYIKVYAKTPEDPESIRFTDDNPGNCGLNGVFPINATIGIDKYPAREVYFTNSSRTDEATYCNATYFFSLSLGSYIYNIVPSTGPGSGGINFDGKAEVGKSLPEFSKILSTFRFYK